MPTLEELMGLGSPGLPAQSGIGTTVPPQAAVAPTAALVPPQVAGELQQQQPGGWTNFLSQPANRAFLLSAGMQLMTGGWGNGVQQAGAALGKGAEAASAVTAAEQENAMTQKKLDQSEENARIGADSRAEVANIRTAAMLDRTKMNLSARAAPTEALKYRQEARKIYEGNLSNMRKSQEEREAEIEDLAGRMYDADRARGVGATKANSAVSGSPEGGATTAPGGNAAKATSTAEGKKSWSELMKNPTFKAAVETEEGRAQILAKRPEFKGNLDAYFAPVN